MLKLSQAILNLNSWFFSTQNAYYSWFMSEENEGVEKFINDSSSPLHTKYIIDGGDYSFLLADINGKVERLTPAFELTEESMHYDDNVKIMARPININGNYEMIRYLPAKSDYDFPVFEEDNDTSVNKTFLDVVDDVFDGFLSEAYATLDAQEKRHISKQVFNKKILDSLAEKILPYNYMIDFEKEAKEYGSVKDVCDLLIQAAYSPLSEYALNKAKEEFKEMLTNNDLESDTSDSDQSEQELFQNSNMQEIYNMQADSIEAYLSACAVVMVCDKGPDEDKLMGFTKTALKSQLAINLVKTLNEATDDSNNLSYDPDDQLKALLKTYDGESTQNIINNVNNAWKAAQSNNNQLTLIDTIAGKIGNNLSSYVLGSCIDTAAMDGELQDEERFVLAQFAILWNLEEQLCENLHEMSGKYWSIQEEDGRQVLAISDDANDKESSFSELWQAIANKDVDKAKGLIAQGEPVDETIDLSNEMRNITPLMVVAEQFDKELCHALIDAGADINAISVGSAGGYAPLTLALKGDNIANFKLLLTAGANPNPIETGSRGYSPLSMAAKHGLEEAVYMLISNNADINWVDDLGRTALREAVNCGHTECVELLLKAGVNAASYDSDGFSPLHNAASNGYNDIVKILLDAGVDVDFPLSSPAEHAGQTALNSACWFGHMEVVKTLVERGASVVNHGFPVDDAVGGAAERSEDPYKMAKYLIDKGALTSFQAVLMAQMSMPVPTFELLFNRIAKRKEPLTSDQVDECKDVLTKLVEVEEDEVRRKQVINVINSAGAQWQLNGI